MITAYQYVLLSSPPEKEEKFRRLKEEHGSVFAFHGSRVENWHSILRYPSLPFLGAIKYLPFCFLLPIYRHGLKNASGTKLQLNGAAYGAGIYLSPQSATSFGYSQFHGGRHGHKQNRNQVTLSLSLSLSLSRIYIYLFFVRMAVVVGVDVNS